jgi:streptomycin 6-kinase
MPYFHLQPLKYYDTYPVVGKGYEVEMNLFESNVISIYPDKGPPWLANLPHMVQKLSAQWTLSDLKPMRNLSYNYVLCGFQGTQPIILKLGLDIAGLDREAAALKVFESSRAAVKLLAQQDGALLLEQAIPGILLKSYFPTRDYEAITITCALMKKLHQAPLPLGHVFPHISDWLSTLDKNWDIPGFYLEKARALRDQLLKTSAREVLLHGDLHHENILQNGKKFVAIDPKGIIGEPAFEVAAFIRNPIPDLLYAAEAIKIISLRIKEFADILNMDAGRILKWCLVQAVLAWAWSLEDNTDPAYFKHLTRIFDELEFV